MRTTITLIIGAIVIAVIVSACAGNSNSGSPVDNSSAAAVSDDPYGDILDSDPVNANALCKDYNSLVEQGWNHETIYSELNAAGAFDGYGSAGKAFYDRLVKWCYGN